MNQDQTGRRPTRNITVAIQYAFVNGGRGPQGNVLNNGVNATVNTPANASPSPVADGAFVLNFTDVPESTTQERFDEIIALAADVAMNRLTRRLQRFRGVGKEAFEALPVKRLKDVHGEVCSICYDNFEEENEEEAKEEVNEDDIESREQNTKDKILKSKKRARGEHGKEEEDNLNVKKQRSVGPEEGSSSTGEQLQQEPHPLANIVEEHKEKPSPEYKHSPTQLKCGHTFGRMCIYQWTKEHNSCPICRAEIVGREGLNRDLPDEETGDGISFDRIRELLYGSRNSTNLQVNDSTNNTDAPDTNTATEPQRAGTRANFFVLRPHHSAGEANTAPNPSNNAASNVTPALPLVTRQGFGLVPITFVNLRGNNNTTVHNNSNTASGSNANSDSTGTSNSNTNQMNNNANSGTDNQQPQDSDRLLSILDHLFSLSNGNRPRPEPSTRSNAEPVPNGENNEERRPLFSSFVRFARNLRNARGSQDAGAQATTQAEAPSTSTSTALPTNSTLPNLFSTGVASFRNGTGVSTVDFNGEMPVPSQRTQGGDSNDRQQNSSSRDNSSSQAQDESNHSGNNAEPSEQN